MDSRRGARILGFAVPAVLLLSALVQVAIMATQAPPVDAAPEAIEAWKQDHPWHMAAIAVPMVLGGLGVSVFAFVFARHLGDTGLVPWAKWSLFVGGPLIASFGGFMLAGVFRAPLLVVGLATDVVVGLGLFLVGLAEWRRRTVHRLVSGVALVLGIVLVVVGVSPRPDPHLAQLAVVLWLVARATCMGPDRTVDEVAPATPSG